MTATRRVTVASVEESLKLAIERIAILEARVATLEAKQVVQPLVKSHTYPTIEEAQAAAARLKAAGFKGVIRKTTVWVLGRTS